LPSRGTYEDGLEGASDLDSQVSQTSADGPSRTSGAGQLAADCDRTRDCHYYREGGQRSCPYVHPIQTTPGHPQDCPMAERDQLASEVAGVCPSAQTVLG